MIENQHEIKLLDINESGQSIIRERQIVFDKNLSYTASHHTHNDNAFLEPENLTSRDFIESKFKNLANGLTTDGQPIANNKRVNYLFSEPRLELPEDHCRQFTTQCLRKSIKTLPEASNKLLSIVKKQLKHDNEIERKLAQIVLDSISKDLCSTSVSDLYLALFIAIKNSELSQDDLINYERQQIQEAFNASLSGSYLRNNRCILGNELEMEVFLGSFNYGKSETLKVRHSDREPILVSYLNTTDLIRAEMFKETMANYLYILERQICRIEHFLLTVFLHRSNLLGNIFHIK